MLENSLTRGIHTSSQEGGANETQKGVFNANGGHRGENCGQTRRGCLEHICGFLFRFLFV